MLPNLGQIVRQPVVPNVASAEVAEDVNYDDGDAQRLSHKVKLSWPLH
jgi:hypothetical protein